MQYGKVVYKFNHKGRKVVLRYPKMEDVKNLMALANSLVRERAYISIQKKMTQKEEIKWLLKEIKGIEDKKSVLFLIEVDGIVFGSTGVTKKERPADEHVGDLGIIMRKEIRNIRLGQKIIPLVIKEARKKLKIKIARLDLFSKNKIAFHVYKKCGFKKCGEIKGGIKHYGKYGDKILMVKYL